MPRFVIRGSDRQVGAIGIMEEFSETLEAESAADAAEKVRMARYAAGREHVLCKEVSQVSRVRTTERPWHVAGAFIVNGEDRIVTVMVPRDERGTADAELIVRAINVHDALVAAVQVILDVAQIDVDEERTAMDALAEIRAEARAAMKLAEGREP